MDRYVVTVTVEIPAPPLEILDIVERLLDVDASVARVDGDPRLEVGVTVDGDDIEHAAAMAIWKVNSIALGQVVGLDICTEAEHHRRGHR